MIWTAVVDLVGNIFGGVNDHFKAKRELKKAKVNSEIRMLENAQQHTIDWEKLWAAQASGSLKDEWWTAIVSIPLILVFVPDMVEHVKAGFAALEELPEWYVQMVMIAFGASFGVRIVPKGFNILKGLAKRERQ